MFSLGVAIEQSCCRFKAANAIDSVNCTPIGASRPRDGGRPFRLHILLNPYDLIDSNCAALLQPSIDGKSARRLGSVTHSKKYCLDILEKEMGRFIELVVVSGTENLLPSQSLIITGFVY